MDKIIKKLRSHAFHFCSERELQDGIASLFPEAIREARLNAQDVIDFRIGDIGIECKVDRSVSEVTRQIFRYCQTDLKGIILVTTKHRHEMLPAVMNGRPIEVIVLEIGF
jgi:hypothetical protein